MLVLASETNDQTHNNAVSQGPEISQFDPNATLNPRGSIIIDEENIGISSPDNKNRVDIKGEKFEGVDLQDAGITSI